MTLYINACVRKESRTDRIAAALLNKLGDPFQTVRLADEPPAPLSAATLEKRTLLAARRDFSDPMFGPAKRFAAADTIVIAAPYWDYSYPALLKTYLETIYVIGLVSEYDETGTPRGLCRAKTLYYVTTAGGRYRPDYSYDHIRRLATEAFGIPDTVLIAAEMLDVAGFDAERIVSETIARL